MATRYEGRPTASIGNRRWLRAVMISGLFSTLAGCGGGPSDREVKNARAFEALLTAVSLKNAKELEKDARLIDERHETGDLSDARHKDLQEIVAKARAGDWDAAETRAYDFRKEFGDRGSYFK